MNKTLAILLLLVGISFCIDCSYIYKGQTYDLSPLTLTGDNYEAPDGLGGIVSLNICGYSNAGCSGADEASVCQVLGTSKFNCGRLSEMTLGPNLQETTEPRGGLITYSGGTFCGNGQRMTNVYLNCKTDEPTASITDVSVSSDGCTFNIQMNTKYVCPKPHGLSGGSIFLIIVACGLFAYCAVGILYKALKLGAKGPEVIPNFDFWTALPVLVRDGFVLVIRTLTCKTGARSQEYSSL